jgi:hypothetical protein
LTTVQTIQVKKMSHYDADDEFTNDLEDSPDLTQPDLTADEIGERTVAEFYRKTWGERVTAERVGHEQPATPYVTPSAGTLYIGSLTDIAHITNALFKSDVEETSQMRPTIPPELIKRRDQVREYASKILGSERAANAWFERPMAVALGRRRPVEHLQTLEGCDAVEEFLRSLYPPEDDGS